MRRLLIGLCALTLLAVAPVGAQPPNGQGYSQDELDQLLAPVALYPDQLLMQVLIAATYPLEVVEAARFVQQNPNLKGDALDQALADKNWDPSVQSLAAFPQVLAMMSDKLEWMQRLGDAFLVDQQRVMDTVQALRQRAQAAGNLQSTPQQSVIAQDNEIMIEPVQPDVVYVPVYDPFLIYGPWWAPAYPPWFWYPPPIYGYPVGVVITTGIFFGTAWAISHHHWGWVHPDWHGHHINVNITDNRFWNRPEHPRPSPGGTWQHEPGHRRGVAYPDAATHDRFVRVDPNAVRARQDFRGHELAQPVPNIVRPSANVTGPTPNLVRPTPDLGRPAPNVMSPTPNVVRPTPNLVRPTPDLARPAPNVMSPTPNVVRPTPGLVRPTPNVVPPAANVVRSAPSAGLPMPQAVRPLPRPAAPTFDPGLSRQQAQMNAQRGLQSRQSIGAAPAAGSRAPSGAPAPRGGVRQR